MRRLLCIRALLLFAVTIFVTACADKSQPQQADKKVDDSVFDQVSPEAFDRAEDAELSEKLEIREKGGTLWAKNEFAGVTGKFFTDSNIIATDDDNSSGVELEIAFTTVRRQGAEKPTAVRLGKRSSEGNVVKRRSGAFEEYFANRREGIEHGLVITEREDGDGPLIVGVDLRGGYKAYSISPESASLEHPRGPAFTYTNLVVYDAKGTRIPAFMWPQYGGTTDIAIEVYDDDAVYPIVVDPTISRQGPRVWPPSIKSPSCNSDVGACGFGQSVDVHGDVMVVGIPQYPPPTGAGAVQVYVKEGSRDTCSVNSDCDVYNGERCESGSCYELSWQLVRTFVPPAGPTWEDYGHAVSVSRRGARYIIVVGDPGAEAGEGRAEIIQIDRTDLLSDPPVTGTMNRQLIDAGPSSVLASNEILPGDNFGFDVATNGSTTVIGQPGRDSDAGRAVVLGWASNTSHIYDTDFRQSAIDVRRTGESVAVDSNNRLIAVGAPEGAPVEKAIKFQLQLAALADGTQTYTVSYTPEGTGPSTLFSFSSSAGSSVPDFINDLRTAFLASSLDGTVLSDIQAGPAPDEITVIGQNPGNDFTVSLSSSDSSLTVVAQSVVDEPEKPSGVLLYDIVASDVRELQDSTMRTGFGRDVDVQDDKLVVGAPTTDDSGNVNAGAVHDWTLNLAASPASISAVSVAHGTNDQELLGHRVFTTGVISVASALGVAESSVPNNGEVRRIGGGFSASVLTSTEPGVYFYEQASNPAGRQLGYALAWDPLSDTSTPTYVAGAPGLTYDRDGIGGDDNPQGAVVTFDAGTMQQITRERANMPDMEFGNRVHIGQNLMAVSAPGHKSPYTTTETGVIYLYERPGLGSRDWKLVEVIEPAGTTGGFAGGAIMGFAPAVATNGTLIAVSVNVQRNLPSVPQVGIQFYRWDSSTDTLTGPETVSGADPNDSFLLLDSDGDPYDGPVEMDFAGNTLVVGLVEGEHAVQIETSGVGGTAVPLFDMNKPVAWASGYGSSVAVNPERAVVVVGAPNSNSEQGGVFTWSKGAGGQPPFPEVVLPEMVPPFDAASLGIAPNDRFGQSVDFDEETLVVGAPGTLSGAGIPKDGALYFFDITVGTGISADDTLNLAQFDGNSRNFLKVDNSDFDAIVSTSGGDITAGSNMGTKVALDVYAGTDGTVVSNDHTNQAIVTYTWNAGAGLWEANDYSPTRDGIDDDPALNDFYYPNSLALPFEGTAIANYVVAGSPESAFYEGVSVQATTGSYVFHQIGAAIPADTGCDGVDDDGDGLVDEDSCLPLGPLACLGPGSCLTSCNPILPSCPGGTTCRLNLGLTLTVCEPNEPCTAPGNSLRMGICMEECDPSAPSCSVGGEVCYANPGIGPAGYCAPDSANGGVCDSDGFSCLVDDDGDPEACYRGECLEPCTADTECTAAPGGKCQPNSAFPAIGEPGMFCDYPDACGETWCEAGTTCYEGQCYATCDGNPATTGECATSDDPVTGQTAACFVDLSTGTDAFCMDQTGPCAGIFCPNDDVAGQQTCVDGECMEYCDNVNTVCSVAGEVCDLVNSYCVPADPCTQIFCEESLTCYEGSCKESCDPQSADTCVGGTSCVERPGGSGPTDGICIDTDNPCDGIVCPPVAGVPQTCYLGECFRDCSSNTCLGNDVCDPTDDRCVPTDICDSVICPAGADCFDGYCRESCVPGSGSCPIGEVCAVDPTDPNNPPTSGRCVPDVADPCANVTCPPTASGDSQTCYEGSCYPVCVDDDDCTPPNICYDSSAGQFCNTPDPCDTVWCPFGDVCFEGSCFDTCTACTDTCFDNLNGAGDDRCATNACEDVLCPFGDICVNGRCGTPCSTTANCSDSHLCQDGCDVNAPGSDCNISGGGICLPSDCDGIHCPIGESCSNGVCGTSCTNDGECTVTGEVCYDGACVPDPCDPDPCGSGTCYGGACYDQCTPATVGEDCAAGQICEDGRCTEGPCSGVDCPIGQVCFEGSCYDPCADDGDCTPPNLCFNGVCASDPCEGVTCPFGEVCYGGSCAPPCGTTTACQTDVDCLVSGETCQNINPTTNWGYCTDCGTDECWVSGCLDDTDCANGDYCFKNGTSISGVCLETGCDPTASPGCEDGMLSCRGSECEGVQCPIGQVCYEGSCYDPCSDNGDCTPPNECYSGVCTDDLCRGTHCPIGQVCYGGSCYDPCEDNGDCSPPNVCFDGRCADTACSGPDGPNSVVCPIGEVCIQGGCFEACTVNTDCGEFIGTGDFIEVAVTLGLDIDANKEGGFTWSDFNKDGCLDLAVNTDGYINSRILMSDCNLPNPAYTDITPSLADHLAYNREERSMVAGDFNNDGYNDLLRTGGSIEMYLNRWDGVDPYDGSTGWGINSWGRGGGNTPNQNWGGNPEGAGILDYDGDQDLDFIVQEDDEIALFTNDGSGNFNRSYPGYFDADEDGDYCAVADFDVDGDVDVLCRFDEKNEGDEGRDMYRNDGGTFTDVGWVDEEGRNSDKSGVVFCDYDNDGDFDLFWGGEGVNQFWEQPSSGNWIQTGKPTSASGFDLNQGNREVEGVDCGDVDNDGDMDLFVARGDKDKLFINQLNEIGTATFVADNRGINEDDSKDTEQGTFVDFDNDGDLDIYTNHDERNYLWRNPLTGNDYMMVRPRVDLGGGVYRDAIGATITIRDPDGTMLGVREANGGSGRGSQRQIPVHIGLANGDNVPYHLTVQFPHNPVEVVELCVVPNTLSGYRVLRVDNTDSDDMAACGDPNWADNIITAASGEFCFEDHCAANACDDIQCSDGFICVGGSCVESCNVDTDCPNFPDDICYQNRCADADNPACDNVKCPSNQTCYAGECFKDCAGPSDCDGNQICYQDRCADPTCNKISGNCLTGEICHQGTCFEDCSSDPSICPTGTTCWDGRCATDSCAAMMDNYEANHVFTATGRKLTADQYSRPYMWPRPVVNPAGTSINSFVQYDSTLETSNTPNVHETNKAKVVLYLDETLADASNPRGYYVLWLTHGRTSAAQAPARANYQVRLKHNGDAALDTLFVDDANESFRRLTDGGEEIVVAQITSENGTTGGIALGPLPSESQDWTISLDANFSGAIDEWEMYNPELGNGVALKMSEQVTIRSLPMSPDIVLAPEVGFACDMPPEALLNGNCDNGTLACSTANLGYTRCDQTVFPAAFELCDGEDNNCEGTVDEPLAIRVPYVQFNQNDGWKYWVPADSNNDFVSDIDYTLRGTDDRTGSTNYIGLEGTPMQATQKSLVFQHRDLVRGDLTVGFLHGANAPSGSDRNVDMNLDFPGDGTSGSQSFREAFIAYYDDGQPAADEVPKNLDAGNFEIEMAWQLDEISGTRESDGVGIRPNYHQPFDGRLTYFDMEFDGVDGNNDDWTDDGLQWLMYQPMLLGPDNENELLKSRELDMRVGGLSLGSTFCPAAAPITETDPMTGVTETCELGRYTCSTGVLSCGAATLDACDICLDNDFDGYPLYDPALCPNGTDCNDDDPNIYPGAPERCNGLDDDCDTQIDVKTNVTGGDCGPGGGAECGPAECEYRNICVCPDNGDPCFCGSTLEPGGEPAEPAPADDAALFENRGAACSAAGGSPLDGDLPWLLIVGAAGLVVSRRRRR